MEKRHEFCNHYQAAALHKACKKGVEYTSLGGPRAELPCWNEDVGGCELAEYPTVEQRAKRDKEIAEKLESIFGFMSHKTDICPHCGKQVKSLRQVGRCVYGSCGCRLWQGKVPKEWKDAKS